MPCGPRSGRLRAPGQQGCPGPRGDDRYRGQGGRSGPPKVRRLAKRDFAPGITRRSRADFPPTSCEEVKSAPPLGQRRRLRRSGALRRDWDDQPAPGRRRGRKIAFRGEEGQAAALGGRNANAMMGAGPLHSETELMTLLPSL